MENQFLDYASWRKSNDKLLTYLINNKSLIIARFKYVIAVVDYLFDKVINEKYELDNNENEMFEVGYQYIFDRFMTINLLLEKSDIVFASSIISLISFGVGNFLKKFIPINNQLLSYMPFYFIIM